VRSTAQFPSNNYLVIERSEAMKIRNIVLITVSTIGLCASVAWAAFPADPVGKCAPDAVPVGPVCVDKYEASIWQIPAASLTTWSGKGLIKKIQKGKVKLSELGAGGATQLSPSSSCSPGFDSTFSYTGNWTPVAGTNPPTPGIYAVSVAGVHPTACVSWFQAAQACRLAGKRLLTNAEWQDAAAGTFDPGSNDGTTNSKCNTSGEDVRNTGSAGGTAGGPDSCISNWGAQDMVGNVAEWVADWGSLADGCTDWTSGTGIPGGDHSCMGNLGSTSSFYHIAGALIRGGWGFGSFAGVFAVNGFSYPSYSASSSSGSGARVSPIFVGHSALCDLAVA
jgi:hypothetical protein